MKLFSLYQANFAASRHLTESGQSHLIEGNTKSYPSAGGSVLSRASVPGENKRELYMKAMKLFTLVVGSSLMVSASAFAGNSNKKTLHLYESVTLEGQQLPPGNYRFEWSGTGPDVKVDILKGKETVASVSARIVAVPVSNKVDGYSATDGKDGSHSLTTVFFNGDKYDLEMGDASTANGSQTTDPKGSN